MNSETLTDVPKSRASFLIAVVVPTILTCIYLLFLAEPTYQTEVKLLIRENSESGSGAIPGFASSILGLGSKTSMEDAFILADYLHSSAFLQELDSHFDLRRHFADSTTDVLRRLADEPLREQFDGYVRKMLITKIDPESSILTLQIQAFDPELARAMALFIIERAEDSINTLNDRMVASQTAMASRELEDAKQKMMGLRNEMLEFQIRNSMIDPVHETGAFFSNIAAIDAKLVAKRTELRIKEQYMQDDAAEMRTLRQELTALAEQRAEETRRLVSEADGTMADVLRDYEMIKLRNEFALNAYSAAFALAERANIDAARQEKFLLIIAPPHLPEQPVFPRPMVGTLTALALLSVGYGIFRLISATIRDHSI